MTIDDDLLMKLISERNELFEATLRMVEQHCVEHSDGTLDSGFLSANAYAMRVLAPIGGVEMVHNGYGRGVIVRLKDDVDAYQSVAKWNDLFTKEQWDRHVPDPEERIKIQIETAASIPTGSVLWISPRKTNPDGTLEPEEEWVKRCGEIKNIVSKGETKP